MGRLSLKERKKIYNKGRDHFDSTYSNTKQNPENVALVSAGKVCDLTQKSKVKNKICKEGVLKQFNLVKDFHKGKVKAKELKKRD